LLLRHKTVVLNTERELLIVLQKKSYCIIQTKSRITLRGCSSTETSVINTLRCDAVFAGSGVLRAILKSSYFPRELPDPFNTKDYSAVLTGGANQLTTPFTWDQRGPGYVSRPALFNLARAGTLRRQLEILNPVNFYHVAKIIVDSWQDIKNHVGGSSRSLSMPKYTPSDSRAIQMQFSFSDAEKKFRRLVIRNGAKHTLVADISQFYPTVYTHSIPWALHGRAKAKVSRTFSSLLGNKLDQAIRNGRSQQTKGISIGPDTSLVIAEILLSTIDGHLNLSLGISGFAM